MVSPNAVAQPTSYVAVLKAKRGELTAVGGTPPERFIPLLEVVEPTKHAPITKAWPHPDDVLWVQPINSGGSDEQDWADAVTQLFDDLRGQGTAAVPTVTVEEDPAIYAAVGTIAQTDGRGIVLRLESGVALDEDPSSLAALIDDVLTACGVTPAETDLVIDASLASGGVAIESNTAGSVLGTVPHIDSWRNVVVAFSGFPETVGSMVEKSSIGSIPRTDAAAFRHLTGRWSGRDLLFGDFAVGVPTYADVAFSPIPNIRYALDGEWRVHRAASRSNPSPQYRDLASDLASATYFAGAAFSPGDAYIAAVASAADGPGNAESYLRAAMSRHFHVVLDSLATHGAP